MQGIKEDIDKLLITKLRWRKGQKEALEAFRGQGNPSGVDIVYSSISQSTLDKETVVGLQEKFLYVMEILQSADENPTSQNIKALAMLEQRFNEMVSKWNALNK